VKLDAILKVKANVQGQGEIDGLSRSLGNLNKQAGAVGGGLGRMGQAAKGVGGLMGALLPVGAVAGLTAIAKGSIDAADNLNDMSQRTGVAVESLSRFGQAAQDSGSSIEGVAKGMGQLAKRITDPSSAASKALSGIGVATRDAQGKVRSLDAVMLEISDRFAKMPDGAEKSALAMQLFGKSGVELIPMLNQGRAALEQYQATISGDMAKSADEFNDSLNAIGRSLSGPFNEAVTALLPAITSIAQGIVGIIKAFTALPQPVQATLLVIGGLLTALVALAPAISAIISIGSALAGLFAAGGALASAGSIIAGLATAFIVLITGPVGIVALLVAAGVAIYAFRDQIGAAFNAVVNFIGGAFNTIGDLLKAGAQAYMDYYVSPILGFFKGLYDGAVAIFGRIGSAIGGAFQTVVATIKNVFRSVLQYLADRVNFAAGLINVLIRAFNRLPAPDIPLIPQLTVPAFAQGGVVDRPTLAMVGEGGEREYVVPESKMAAASSNYLAGARGGAVLAGAAPGGGTPTINVTTGPVMEFDGQRYVTVTDMERAMRLTAEGVIGRLRTPSARIALGMA
jgi:phage-related protein